MPNTVNKILEDAAEGACFVSKDVFRLELELINEKVKNIEPRIQRWLAFTLIGALCTFGISGAAAYNGIVTRLERIEPIAKQVQLNTERLDSRSGFVLDQLNHDGVQDVAIKRIDPSYTPPVDGPRPL